MIAAMQALEAEQIPAMSADAVIKVLQARCDELLEVVADRDRTIALQVQKAIKIESGDIERLADLAACLRSDPRQIWGACIDSLERVLANVREA